MENRREIMSLYRTAQRGGLVIDDIRGIFDNISRASKMQDFLCHRLPVVHHAATVGLRQS
jgi:hypothetical protein